MKLLWLKGSTTPKEKEDREREILSYRVAFSELKELLEGSFEDTTPDYNSPSWAYSQADVNGANRKLREIISLITIEE